MTKVDQEVSADRVSVDIAAVGSPSWAFERVAAGDVMEFSEFEQFMQAHGRQPDGLERLQRWVRARHGDGPLDDDFSIVRIRF